MRLFYGVSDNRTPAMCADIGRWVAVAVALVLALNPPASAHGHGATVEWRTSLGSGGAFLPEARPRSTTDDIDTPTLTNVVGVVFAPNGRDLFFVGDYEPGDPFGLIPSELADGFVAALRALAMSEAPGVTIEFTPEQARHGLEEDDLMPIRYFGHDAVEHSAFGAVALNADLALKHLQMCKNNVTKAVVTSRVPGHQCELDDEQDARDGKRIVHRIWITPRDGAVMPGAQSRGFILKARLRVEARRQLMTPSGLVDDPKRPPTAHAARSAAQITQHYDAYARESPPLRTLLAYAKLTYLADALLKAWENDAHELIPEGVDLQWFLEHYAIRAVEPITETPATVVSDTLRSRQGATVVTRTRVLTGGVDMTPHRAAVTPSARAHRLERAVLEAGLEMPQSLVFTIDIDGTRYRVVRVRGVSSSPIESWQSDLEVGTVNVIRDYVGARTSARAHWGNWRLRIPEIVNVDPKTQQVGAFSVPRSIRVRDHHGNLVTLNRLGMIEIPGAAPAPALIHIDGRRRMVLTKVHWRYYDGNMRWRSTNGGPLELVVPTHGAMIEFEAASSHAVREYVSDTGTVTYAFSRGRLQALQGARGERVTVHYSRDGLIDNLQASNGTQVTYSVEGDRLIQVVNNQGALMRYVYASESDVLTGVDAVFETPIVGLRPGLGIRLTTDGQRPHSPHVKEDAL